MNVRHIVVELPNTSQPHKISSGEEDQMMAAHWSDEATTTGDSSDNDSASESDGESHGNTSRKRHACPTVGPVEGRLPPSDSCWQSHSVQHPRRRRLKQQPLPRKVDYTIRSADLGRKPLTPVTGQESAPLVQTMMGVAQRAALDQGQGLQASSRAATKIPLMTTTLPSGGRIASTPSKEVRLVGGLVWKKRTTLPVKGANINAPVPRRSIPDFRGRRDGSADSTAPVELMPPPSSKDHSTSSLPSFDGRRSRTPGSISANSNSGSSSEGCCFWPRSARAARLSPIRRLPRKESATVAEEAVPDLACYEVLDLDAVMLSGGEVRRPICRYLLPCWPEGVEGYEEVGGWRRLGGAAPDSSQKGRRRA